MGGGFLWELGAAFSSYYYLVSCPVLGLAMVFAASLEVERLTAISIARWDHSVALLGGVGAAPRAGRLDLHQARLAAGSRGSQPAVRRWQR